AGGDRAARELAAVDLHRIDAAEQVEVIRAVLFEDAQVSSVHAAGPYDDLVSRGRADGGARSGDSVHLRTGARTSPDFKGQHSGRSPMKDSESTLQRFIVDNIVQLRNARQNFVEIF